MTAALEGWRVLVPHAGEWGDRVSRLLAEHGASATVVPLIEFAPPDDVEPLDDAVRRLADGRYTWLVVTSSTTVRALSARAARLRPGDAPSDALADVLRSTPVAAVGPGTTRTLEDLGIRPELVPTGERSARGLAAEMPPAPAGPGLGPATVLLPHSDLAERTLADGLEAKGWSVDAVVAYRTVLGRFDADEVREDLRAGWFDAVLLSSGSTVRNLVDAVGPPAPSTVVVCIGPSTRRAALDAGLDVHVVAPDPSAEGLVTSLADHATRMRAAGRPPSAAGTARTPSAPPTQEPS